MSEAQKSGHDNMEADEDSREDNINSDESNSLNDFIADDDEDSQSQKKHSKKHKKKKKALRKAWLHKKENESFDEEDYEIAEKESHGRRRLKRAKDQEPRHRYQHSESGDIQKNKNFEGIGDNDEFSQQDYERGPQQLSQSEKSSVKQIIANDQIFDIGGIRRHYDEKEDLDIIEQDLGQHQLMQYKSYSRLNKKSLQSSKKQYQINDRFLQSKWIYQRLRNNISYFDTIDQRIIRDKIKNVLQCLHKQHLQIMYIYYYRKKVYSDILNLDILWKIQQLDQQWMGFKDNSQKINDKLITVIMSCTDIPQGLQDMLKKCTDMRTLKYFKQYQNFVLSKIGDSIMVKKQPRNALIAQMQDRGIIQWLQRSQIFLSPANLCLNFKSRMQDKVPRTPQAEPREQFQKVFRNSNPETDRSRYSLLAPEIRMSSIANYLKLQLYTYPELRKILRDKYYKKLVISTNPTLKGNQDINLYSMFYPVKRIRDKPIATLKRDMWMLAVEAQKLGLIKIDLKFEWELTFSDVKNFQNDSVCLQLSKYYFDISAHRSGQTWNLYRKQILTSMLQNYFFPSFFREIREELTREGQKDIIMQASQKFKHLLNKGPSLKDGKPTKILALVLSAQKLGMAFVDEKGNSRFTLSFPLINDDDLKTFISGQVLSNYIKQHRPDMILISANCRRAQSLRKQLRNPNLFIESIYCSFGQYEVPSLIAKKKLINGQSEEQHILEAISMARMKKNPMAQIISLWSENINQNGVLSMNLHPYQSFVSRSRLKDALEKVAIEVVSLVGLNINDIKDSEHLQNQLQFVNGLGPRKAHYFLEKLTEEKQTVTNRRQIVNFVAGEITYKNCSPFFRVEVDLHRAILQKAEKDKKKIRNYDEANLLDMTRIPEEWYSITNRLVVQGIRSNSLLDIRSRKGFSNLTDQTISMVQILKHPEKIRSIEWNWKQQQNPFFDEQLVKAQIMSRFKNPRDPERVMENKQTFFNLLRETPEALKRYTVMTVKALNMKKNYLNVIVPENGLFGFIKLNDTKTLYEKGQSLKAVLIGFPFDQKKHHGHFEDQQQLLKVQMALNFPHKTDERNQHDCFTICFPQIVKQIHPNIDLDKDRFQLRKQDRPIIEIKQQRLAGRSQMQMMRISHPKFKNIALGSAIQYIKSQPIGEFIVRPSSQGGDYLTITWNFFKGVIAHIKIKSEQKSLSNSSVVYRILDKDKDKIFNSLEDIIDKYIKPMNILVQDVISNKKFLPLSIDQIDNQIKKQMQKDPTHIHYYFGVTEDYPQFFILAYMYKDKRPIKELIRVRGTGLFFHNQAFSNLKDLIIWFKEHLKEKEYQRFAKSNSIKK